MEVGITVMVAVMREEVEIGTTIRMGAMKIVGTTEEQIVLVVVGVVGAGDASLLLL